MKKAICGSRLQDPMARGARQASCCNLMLIEYFLGLGSAYALKRDRRSEVQLSECMYKVANIVSATSNPPSRMQVGSNEHCKVKAGAHHETEEPCRLRRSFSGGSRQSATMV